MKRTEPGEQGRVWVLLKVLPDPAHSFCTQWQNKQVRGRAGNVECRGYRVRRCSTDPQSGVLKQRLRGDEQRQATKELSSLCSHVSETNPNEVFLLSQ
jgi:hypothetical protein